MPHFPKLRSWRGAAENLRIASRVVALLLCAIGLLALLGAGAVGGTASVIAVAICMAILLPLLNRGAITPAVVSAALAILLLGAGHAGAAIADGLGFAAGLAGFLGAVLAFRQALLAEGLTARVGDAVARLAPNDRAGAFVLIGFVLGAVLSVGTFLFVGPLVEASPSEERRKAASAALCGACLAFFWSPLPIGMIVVTGFLADPTSWAEPLLALMVVLPALLVAITVHGGARDAAVAAATVGLMPLFFPLVAIVTGAILARIAFDVPLGTGVVVSIGILIATQLLAGRTDKRLFVATWERLPAAVADLPLYLAGFILARALGESGFVASLADYVLATGIVGRPEPVLIAVTLGLALAGLNAVVCVSVVMTVGAALNAPTMLLFLAGLFAWVAASMVGFTSATITIAASSFQVTPLRLIRLRNLGVLATLGATIAAFGMLVAPSIPRAG